MERAFSIARPSSGRGWMPPSKGTARVADRVADAAYVIRAKAAYAQNSDARTVAIDARSAGARLAEEGFECH